MELSKLNDNVRFVCNRHPELLAKELVKKAVSIRSCDICKESYFKEKPLENKQKEDERLKDRDEWLAKLRLFYNPTPTDTCT